MLYVIYGTDSHKTRKKLHELLGQASKKRPDAELFKLTTENWSEAQFDELLVSQGLFSQKYTVVLDNLFEKKDIKTYIIDRLENVAQSDQIFLMLEGSVDVTTLKKIEKVAKQVQKFEKAETGKPNFNIFSVTEGLVGKDKRKLWVSYMDSLGKGTAPEEIHGIFFWQIKNMLLASRAKNANETGLTPYAYKTALSGTRNYKEQELISMSAELVDMTHRVRQGEGDMGIMLEKWVLSI